MNTVPDIRPDWDRPNYDLEKIAPYTLEDQLVFLDGRRVESPAKWPERRREILGIFANEMYGVEPSPPEELVVEKFDECDHALGGFAVRSQYKMRFRSDRSGPEIDWLLLRPRFVKKPVPAIIFLHFRGNHELIPDEDIPVPEMWSRTLPDHADPVRRGAMCDPNHRNYLPLGMLLGSGYAVMCACYCQVSPDPDGKEPDPRFRQETFAYTGVFDLWGRRDEARTDAPTAIGTWAGAAPRSRSATTAKTSAPRCGCSSTGTARRTKSTRAIRQDC